MQNSQRIINTCEVFAMAVCNWTLSFPATLSSVNMRECSNCLTAALHSGSVYGLYWTGFSPKKGLKVSFVLSSPCSLWDSNLVSCR
jgi:hypothetical protein